MKTALGALTAAVLVFQGIRAPARVETLTVPTFGRVVVYAPSGPAAHVVLFVSGDGGWNLGVVSMAERLRDLGAMVVGIDIRTFVRALESSKDCAYPAGALEDLSRAVQLRYHFPIYQRPILVGYSSGATLVYAALAAAPPESFAGAVSLGFCPDLEIRVMPCQMRGLKATKRTKSAGYELAPYADLKVPWMVLQGEVDQVCSPVTTRAFVAATGSARVFSLPKVGHGFAVPRNWEPQFIEAYRAVADASVPEDKPHVSIPGTEGLPLVEVPSAGRANRNLMAVIVSGDGGWADLDKSVAAGLAAAGVPTVGWNSLRYFWTPRTPEGAAGDLARVIRHYTTAWNKQRVLIIGYSFGADVVPFLVNRLPADVRVRVANITLLGLARTAVFEFHVTQWIGGHAGKEYPTPPEIERLTVPVTCVEGVDDERSVCSLLKGAHVRAVTIGRGHHFSGEYDRLVDVILQS